MSRARIVVLAAVAVAFAAGGFWLAATRAPHQHELEQRTDARGAIYYTCPMHPEVRKDEPGNCPICGMQLVKREEAPAPPAAGADAVVVQIDPRMVQNLGIRTAPVTRGTFAHELDAVGAVEIDERRIVVIESRAAGWVERLDVRAVGEPVRRGQIVAGVYAPELYAAQEELALAVRSRDPALIAASRQRLLLLGAGADLIDAIARGGAAQRRLAIVAPSAGVVTELNVREGQQVMPGTPLMRIADLSQVWVTIEVPEALAASARAGRQAEARLAAVPGRVFEGRVEYVYPNLDPMTRTVRARLAFPNRDGLLKPGMYARVGIVGDEQRNALLVPMEAVIRTGRRSVVMVAESEGRYRPVEVVLGQELEGRIVVLEGLDEGQQVVTSGQFLLDSEASLRGAYRRLEHDAAPPAPAHPHDHGDGRP